MRAAAAALALVAVGCASEEPAPRSSPSPSRPPRNPAALVRGEPYRPVIDPEGFVRKVDNAYFPRLPGTTLVHEGVVDGEARIVEGTITHETKEILGVTTTVVHDLLYADGELVEETFGWYAQDRAGNVWRFGEDRRQYENGEVVSTDGSWEAGVEGAQPGIVMLAGPRIGDVYRQGYAQGEAEDVARVTGVRGLVSVPYGHFAEVLVTEEWSSLEPGVRTATFYARGAGVVLERVTEGGGGELQLVDLRAGED